MPQRENNVDFPCISIVPGIGNSHCAKNEQCIWYEKQMQEKLVGKYIGVNQPFEKQIVSASIPLYGLTPSLLEQRMRKHSKAAAIRQANKAKRNGYVCKLIDPKEHIEDIVSVNLSTSQRAGKPMTDPYKRDFHQLRLDAQTAPEFQPSACDEHWDQWWGVFAPDSESLLGYARIRRNGNYVLYAQWLGHHEYLQDGIMHLLHQSIIHWLLDQTDPQVKGVEHAIYAAWDSGDGGLQRWKRACGFEPSWLVLESETVE